MSPLVCPLRFVHHGHQRQQFYQNAMITRKCKDKVGQCVVKKCPVQDIILAP